MGCYGVMGTAAGLVHLWDVEKGTKVAQLNDLEGKLKFPRYADLFAVTNKEYQTLVKYFSSID